jgi:hypothetical protein
LTDCPLLKKSSESHWHFRKSLRYSYQDETRR